MGSELPHLSKERVVENAGNGVLVTHHSLSILFLHFEEEQSAVKGEEEA